MGVDVGVWVVAVEDNCEKISHAGLLGGATLKVPGEETAGVSEE